MAQKPLRMRLPFSVSFLFPVLGSLLLANLVSADYNVGVGRADITGPAAEVFFLLWIAFKKELICVFSYIFVVSSHM